MGPFTEGRRGLRAGPGRDGPYGGTVLTGTAGPYARVLLRGWVPSQRTGPYRKPLKEGPVLTGGSFTGRGFQEGWALQEAPYKEGIHERFSHPKP